MRKIDFLFRRKKALGLKDTRQYLCQENTEDKGGRLHRKKDMDIILEPNKIITWR